MLKLARCLLVPGVVAMLWTPFVLLAVKSRTSIVIQHGGIRTPTSPYALLLSDTQLRTSLALSTIVATLVGAISAGVAGTLIAVGRSEQARHSVQFKPLGIYGFIIGLGLGLPEIALGLSTSMLLTLMRAQTAILRLTSAHLFLGVSAALGIVLSGSAEIPLTYELAARDSGAGILATSVRVTAPLHKSLLVAAFIAAWLLSFEDLAVAYFVSPPGEQTLPQYIFSLFRFRRLPEAYALGTLMVLAAVLLSRVVEFLLPVGGLKKGHTP